MLHQPFSKVTHLFIKENIDWFNTFFLKAFEQFMKEILPKYFQKVWLKVVDANRYLCLMCNIVLRSVSNNKTV